MSPTNAKSNWEKRLNWWLRETIEIGNCTRDDLHEHLSPDRTAWLEYPCWSMANMTYKTDWAYLRHQRGIRSWQRLSRMTTYLVKLPVTEEGTTIGPESLKNEAAGYGSERAGDMAYGWLARAEGRSNLSKEEGRQKFLVSIDDCTGPIGLLSWLDT